MRVPVRTCVRSRARCVRAAVKARWQWYIMLRARADILVDLVHLRADVESAQAFASALARARQRIQPPSSRVHRQAAGATPRRMHCLRSARSRPTGRARSSSCRRHSHLMLRHELPAHPSMLGVTSAHHKPFGRRRAAWPSTARSMAAPNGGRSVARIARVRRNMRATSGRDWHPPRRPKHSPFSIASHRSCSATLPVSYCFRSPRISTALDAPSPVAAERKALRLRGIALAGGRGSRSGGAHTSADARALSTHVVVLDRSARVVALGER